MSCCSSYANTAYFYQSMISLKDCIHTFWNHVFICCVCISGSLSNVSSDANFSCDSGSTNGSCAGGWGGRQQPLQDGGDGLHRTVTGHSVLSPLWATSSSCSQSRSIDISRPSTTTSSSAWPVQISSSGAFSMNLYTVYINPGLLAARPCCVWPVARAGITWSATLLSWTC